MRAIILTPGFRVILIGHRVRIGRDRRCEDRHHVRGCLRRGTARNQVRPCQRHHFHRDVQRLQLVDQDQAHQTLDLEALDIDIFQLDPAIRPLGLGKIFLGLFHIVARNARHVDLALDIVSERARLQDGVAIEDGEQRIIIEGMGYGLAQVLVGHIFALGVELEAEGSQRRLGGGLDPLRLGNLFELVR